MRLSKALRCSWGLLALALLVGAFALVGPGAGRASAASAPLQGAARPLDGCAPCISSLTPAQNGTVTPDASGKVTLQFAAQLTDNFVQFVLTIDGTAIDSSKIQITSNDPLNPVGQYTAVLAPGQHTASVEVDDVSGPESTYTGWTFTVEGAQPTATPTKKPANNSGSNGGATGTPSSSGLLSPRTLSIILFSIAGLGLVVMAFIAGMWFSGRRALRNEP